MELYKLKKQEEYRNNLKYNTILHLNMFMYFKCLNDLKKNSFIC